jgi:proteasome lid subunit RPN8/RPN11
MLKLNKELYYAIFQEGVKTYPYECCGLVTGILDEEDNREAIRILPINNTREGEDKKRRFVIEPLDFIRAEKEALSTGLSVIGIYHSHPDHLAIPSQYDLDHALPFYSYLIVSIREGLAKEFTSWLLKDDRSEFIEEMVNLI